MLGAKYIMKHNHVVEECYVDAEPKVSIKGLLILHGCLINVVQICKYIPVSTKVHV